MPRYSNERREAVLKKLLPPYNMTVSDVAQQEGMSEQTLYNWRKQARIKGAPVPGPNKIPDNWSTEAKFAVVVKTSTLSEAEVSLYCREKGLYPEQVKSWKQNCLDGFSASPEQKREELKQAKADKKQVRQLKKELRRKEKALAEAAALLVLRKKLKAFYEEAPEDD